MRLTDGKTTTMYHSLLAGATSYVMIDLQVGACPAWLAAQQEGYGHLACVPLAAPVLGSGAVLAASISACGCRHVWWLVCQAALWPRLMLASMHLTPY